MNDIESSVGETVSPSFRHLKLFETVARLQSVRRASEERCLSQPAVTQAIARLEEQVGVCLLERRASGSYLNEYGTIFYRRAERLFAQVEKALGELGVPAGQNMASRITRSQIKSLISIVENGSFSQAARSLDVSQASLHRAARDLERNLRKPLYHRTACGIIATPAGAELARRLKLAMREIELGMEELQAAKGDLAGRINVGVLQLAGSYMLPSVLNEFILEHPNVQVRISNGSSVSMLRSLRVGDVDCVIGLLRDPLPDDLVHEALVEAPYVVVGRRGHPLRSKRKLTLDDLADYDWIVGAAGASRRVCFDALFAEGRRPSSRIETYSLPMIRLLLARSDRLTLLTSFELAYEDDALAALNFGPVEPVHSIGITTRTDWLPTNIQASFLEHVRRRMKHCLLPTKELLRAS